MLPDFKMYYKLQLMQSGQCGIIGMQQIYRPMEWNRVQKQTHTYMVNEILTSLSR